MSKMVNSATNSAMVGGWLLPRLIAELGACEYSRSRTFILRGEMVPMSDPANSPLDAAIDRNAGIVRRSRRSRPFLKRLGLSLPVTVEDVKQAFYARARETHPDHRGSASDFKEVQEAFDKAVEFAERNGKRLPWLGAQLPAYVAQREIVDLVERWGGKVVVKQLDWLEDTVGEDFAQVADRLVELDLSGLAIGDEHLEQIAAEEEGLAFLESCLLTDTEVTDQGMLALAKVTNLKRLDLRGTDVSFSMRRRLAKLPDMKKLEGATRWSELFRG